MGNATTAGARRGRPREFDPERALSAALEVFWQLGYEAASLSELTEAMGITRPSLYACFGNKEALFCKAFDLYEANKLSYVNEALSAPTARGVAERLLRGATLFHFNGGDPKGCLGLIASVTCGAEAEWIRKNVAARRASNQSALFKRFTQARVEGDLPVSIDPGSLACYLTAVLQGLAIQAGSGVGLIDLVKLVDTTLALWPSF